MNTRIIITALLPIWIFSSPLLDLESYSNLHFEEQGIEEQFNHYIQKGDLLAPAGACAYDSYQLFVEANLNNNSSLQRQLKRTLISKLVGAADQKLSLYFDEGGRFIIKQRANLRKGLDQYYSVAATLTGEKHYSYRNLMAKSFFIESLQMQYIENKDTDSIITKLQQSIELDPSASYTYNELGKAYFKKGSYSNACEQYRLATQINPAWEIPRQNLQTAEAALLQSIKK